jgi:hypothetical protein
MNYYSTCTLAQARKLARIRMARRAVHRAIWANGLLLLRWRLSGRRRRCSDRLGRLLGRQLDLCRLLQGVERQGVAGRLDQRERVRCTQCCHDGPTARATREREHSGHRVECEVRRCDIFRCDDLRLARLTITSRIEEDSMQCHHPVRVKRLLRRRDADRAKSLDRIRVRHTTLPFDCSTARPRCTCVLDFRYPYLPDSCVRDHECGHRTA